MADNYGKNSHLIIGEDLLDYTAKDHEEKHYIMEKVRIMLGHFSEYEARKCLHYAQDPERMVNTNYLVYLARLKVMDEYEDMTYVCVRDKITALANMARVFKRSKDPNIVVINKFCDEPMAPTRASDDKLREHLRAIVREYSAKKLTGDARNIVILLSRMLKADVILTDRSEVVCINLLDKLDKLGSARIDEMSLPIRAHKALEQVGINTFRDTLVADFKGELGTIPNLGLKSIAKIREKLDDHFGADFIEELRKTNWWTSDNFVI